MGDTLWTKVTVRFSSAVTGHLSQAGRPLAADPSWFGERCEQGPSWWALPKNSGCDSGGDTSDSEGNGCTGLPPASV